MPYSLTTIVKHQRLVKDFNGLSLFPSGKVVLRPTFVEQMVKGKHFVAIAYDAAEKVIALTFFDDEGDNRFTMISRRASLGTELRFGSHELTRHLEVGRYDYDGLVGTAHLFKYAV